MIQLSSITNAISNIAHSTAVHAKNVCASSKVATIFHTTMDAIQTHPYIALLGVAVTVYYCRTQIESLVNKVKQAAHFLYTKTTESMTSLINFFRRSLASTEEASDSSPSGSGIPSTSTKKASDSSPSGSGIPSTSTKKASDSSSSGSGIPPTNPAKVIPMPTSLSGSSPEVSNNGTNL